MYYCYFFYIVQIIILFVLANLFTNNYLGKEQPVVVVELNCPIPFPSHPIVFVVVSKFILYLYKCTYWDNVKMADEVWKIREDGYLDLDVNCNSITYHPNLNIVLLLSKSSEVLVIDVNSGLLLQKSFLSGESRWLQTPKWYPFQYLGLHLHQP